jgi:hypothetical protein
VQSWRRWLSVVFVAMLSALTVATPAQAVGCYGDYCSSTDPQATGCSADGQVVAATDVYGGKASLQLRWSPTCKTNWARLYIYPSNQWFPSGTLTARQSTGYVQNRSIPSTQGERTHWTPQIYSPTRCVRAEYHSGSGSVYTACI